MYDLQQKLHERKKAEAEKAEAKETFDLLGEDLDVLMSWTPTQQKNQDKKKDMEILDSIE